MSGLISWSTFDRARFSYVAQWSLRNFLILVLHGSFPIPSFFLCQFLNADKRSMKNRQLFICRKKIFPRSFLFRLCRYWPVPTFGVIETKKKPEGDLKIWPKERVELTLCHTSWTSHVRSESVSLKTANFTQSFEALAGAWEQKYGLTFCVSGSPKLSIRGSPERSNIPLQAFSQAHFEEGLIKNVGVAECFHVKN